MQIVHVVSELAPLAKVGGLADMVLGLARESQAKGHKVQVVLPNYDCQLQRCVEGLRRVEGEITCFWDGGSYPIQVWEGRVNGLEVLLVGDYAPKSFFSRGCMYGCADDVDRFLFFSKASLEVLNALEICPEIIHCHDWPVAAVPALLRDLFKETDLAGAKTIFTMHNVDYQGRCSSENLDRTGMQGQLYCQPLRMGDDTWPEAINLMKGGIVYSDAFTTVSPTYAEEIQQPQEGRGLEKTIERHRDTFCGVLNGVDYSYWDPSLDLHLQRHYSHEEMGAGDWSGKDAAKKALRARLNLEDCARPIVSCISRLVPQKGIELMKHALYRVRELGGQFVLLGSSPDAGIQAEFEALRLEYEKDPHVHLVLRNSEELAHQIYAGSDMLLIPSIFEPCGLTQMIALRYGTVPLVRLTGGLKDSIFDIDTSERPQAQRNGFTFEHATCEGVNWALERAVSLWREQPEAWRQLVVNGMQCDFSWRQSAEHYHQLYEKVIASKFSVHSTV